MTKKLKLKNFLKEQDSKFTTDNGKLLYFHDFVEEYENYVVVEFYGGLNGLGKWTNYIDAISELIHIIDEKYNCWLVNLDNDCLDDVFYLKIGIAL